MGQATDTLSRFSVRSLAGVLCLITVFGCGRGSGGNENELHLLLNRHPFTESILNFIPEFEAATGLTVTTLQLSEEEYYEKLITELASRSGYYDVFMCGHPHIWQYAPAGWLEPLDDYLNDLAQTPADYDLDDFFPNRLAPFRWNLKPGSGMGPGKLWAIPVNEEGYVIFYRKDLFERFGVTVPTTYQELYDAAKKLTRVVDGQQIYGFVNRGNPSWTSLNTGYLSSYFSYGAQEFDDRFNSQLNSPQAIELTDLFIRMLKEAGPPGWPGYTWYEGKEGFLSGKFAMWFDSNHQAIAFEDPERSAVVGKVGYMLPPAGPDGAIRSNCWVWALGMNAFSSNKSNAWKFLSWATSKEILLRAVPYQNINPTRRSVWNDPATVAMMAPWADGEYRSTAEQMLTEYAEVRWRPNPQITQVGDRWVGALHEIYTGQKNAEQAMNEATRDINAIMTKSGLRQQ